MGYRSAPYILYGAGGREELLNTSPFKEASEVKQMSGVSNK